MKSNLQVKIFLTFGAFLFMLCVAFGQSRAISGVITDNESGESLIGANVVIKGTTSDINAHFTLGDLSPHS